MRCPLTIAALLLASAGAAVVTPARVLQPTWRNELPFSMALIDATAERGVLVDEKERARLEERERKRRALLEE